MSHNAPLCDRNMHISVTKWCNMGYGTCALWLMRWIYINSAGVMCPGVLKITRMETMHLYAGQIWKIHISTMQWCCCFADLVLLLQWNPRIGTISRFPMFVDYLSPQNIKPAITKELLQCNDDVYKRRFEARIASLLSLVLSSNSPRLYI